MPLRADHRDRPGEPGKRALLLGHGIPAPPTASDFLAALAEAAPPLWHDAACHVPGEGHRGQGLSAAKRRLIAGLPERRPEPTATIALDATILESRQRRAKVTYDGRTGYQSVIALWAEQDVVRADEFRDRDVPAGTGNRRSIEQAIARLPPGGERIAGRADRAAYEQALLRWLEAAGHGDAISADMSRELAAAIRALPETARQLKGEDGDAVRHRAAVACVPSAGGFAQDRPAGIWVPSPRGQGRGQRL